MPRPLGRTSSGGGVHITSTVRELVAELGRVPVELRRELRPRLLAAIRPVQSEARANASWSRRIPDAIGITVRYGARSGGVLLRVNAAKAPHARPFEGLASGGRTFRHPVFGREREIWVSQQARPFLMPAVREGRPHAVRAVREAITATARAHGWSS